MMNWHSMMSARCASPVLLLHAASETLQVVPESTPPAVSMSVQHAAAFAHTVQSLAIVKVEEEWTAVVVVDDETCPALDVEPPVFDVADPEPLTDGMPDPELPPHAAVETKTAEAAPAQ